MANSRIPVNRRKLTPPMIARAWGIDVKKVITCLTNGELRAMNVATHPGQRPRFLVDIDDLRTFESARTITPENAED